MSIKDTTVNQTTSAPVQPQVQPMNPNQQRPQQQFNAQPQAPRNNVQDGWSFNSTSFMRAPISKALGSEYLLKMSTNLTEIYKTADKKYNIDIHPIDNNSVGIRFSCIAVCIYSSNAVQNTVAFHILVLEATGEEIPPLTESWNGQQIEIIRTTSDAVDSLLMEAITNMLGSYYPQKRLHFADATVVPRDFNPEDKNKMHGLAFNTGIACCNHLEITSPDFQDINIARSSKNSNLIIKVGIPRTQIESATGEPIRADILINFRSQLPNQPNQRQISPNAMDREISVSELAGYIDTIYSPVDPNLAYNPFIMNQPAPTQKYAARFVITNLASNLAYTPASVLLALSTVIAVRDENNWIQAFRPSPDTGLDLRDIGALNLEANLEKNASGVGDKIDTKSMDFTLTNLSQYIGALFRQGLVVSLDVPEYGPQMWYLSLFLEAYTNPVAADYLIACADKLTNGGFSCYFPKGTPIFADCQRIHMGYCYLNDDVKRDIRTIDYVAVANIVESKRNTQLLRDWSDTIYRTEYPEDQRLFAQAKILKGMVKELKITGKARRLTFSTAFFEALVSGLIQAELKTQITTPLSTADFNQQRGVAGFVGNALMDPTKTHSFLTRTMGGFQNYQNWQPMGHRVWQ